MSLSESIFHEAFDSHGSADRLSIIETTMKAFQTNYEMASKSICDFNSLCKNIKNACENCGTYHDQSCTLHSKVICNQHRHYNKHRGTGKLEIYSIPKRVDSCIECNNYYNNITRKIPAIAWMSVDISFIPSEIHEMIAKYLFLPEIKLSK